MDQHESMSAVTDAGYDPENTDIGEAVCPYYVKDRGRGRISCECAQFRFPDRLTRREILYRFCAHPGGYKDCALKQAMDRFYERKYAKKEV